MDAVISILVVTGILLALGLAAGLVDRSNFAPRWLVAAGLLVIVNDALLTNVYGALPDAIGGQWNWQGKILATLATLAIAAHPALGWKRAGLTFAQDRTGRGLTWAVAALFAVLFLVLGLVSPDEAITGETLAFQSTMPGLEEELFYRGLLLLAFNEALRGRVRWLGIDVGWGGLLVTLAFGFAHAVGFSDGALEFDPMSFAMTAVPSLVLLWLRERTGSVVLPVVMHNVANTFPLIF